MIINLSGVVYKPPSVPSVNGIKLERMTIGPVGYLNNRWTLERRGSFFFVKFNFELTIHHYCEKVRVLR